MKRKESGLARINFNRKSSGGFTLIELLLVLAIITVLINVVIQSTTSSRNKARDAKIKRTMSEFVSHAAKYATENTASYTGLCSSDEANNLLNSAFNTASVTRGESDCISDDNEYVTAVPLTYKTGYLFCTDQTGNKYEIESTLPVIFTDGSVSCLNQ